MYNLNEYTYIIGDGIIDIKTIISNFFKLTFSKIIMSFYNQSNRSYIIDSIINTNERFIFKLYWPNCKTSNLYIWFDHKLNIVVLSYTRDITPINIYFYTIP